MGMEKLKANPTKCSDDLVRRFLLGDLQSDERASFEHELFIDSDLEERVRLAEFELADDYTFARLSETESNAFRERFLLVTDRHKQVNVSQAIRDRFKSTLSVKPNSGFQRLTNFFDLRRPVWRYAFAAVILMVILATVVKVTKQIRLTKVPSVPVQPKPQPTSTPQQMNPPPGSAPQSHDEQSPKPQVHELPIVIALNSAITAEQAPVVSVPASDGEVIRFRCPLAHSDGVY